MVCYHVLDDGPNGFVHMHPYLFFFCISTIFLYALVSLNMWPLNQTLVLTNWANCQLLINVHYYFSFTYIYYQLYYNHTMYFYLLAHVVSFGNATLTTTNLIMVM